MHDDDVIIIEEYENLDDKDANPAFANFGDDRKHHTRLGIVCFLIGVAGGLIEFVLFLLFGSSSGNSPVDLSGINSGAIKPILIVAAALLLHALGSFVGVLSLVKKEKNKMISIMGLMANIGMIGTIVIFVGISWLVK